MRCLVRKYIDRAVVAVFEGRFVIEFICATGTDEASFRADAPLAASINQLGFDPTIRSSIAFECRSGPAEHYNRAIDSEVQNDILVFVRDDVLIDDYFVGQRIARGLETFDVIGIAGNRELAPGQTSWDPPGSEKTLSGIISRGDGVFAPIEPLGPVPALCEVLCGALLAAKRATLRDSGVRFDPRFESALHDTDFCRSARRAGLRLGTWPIAVTFRREARSDQWQTDRDRYLTKWGDQP